MSTEFERDRSIDPDALDVECLRQSDLFGKWAERAVDGKDQVERLELTIKVVEAEVEIEIRKHPKVYGLKDSPTEASIKAIVRSHKKVIKANHDYLDAKKEQSLLDIGVKTIEMKKRMLEALISLHGMSYFAGPSTPRNLPKMWVQQKAASDKSFAKKQLDYIIRKRNQVEDDA